MSPLEIEYLKSRISKSQRFLEFGAGFSTKLALQNEKIQIISVETSSDYINNLKREITDSGKDLSKIEFIHTDIGPTGDWGRPIDESQIDKWPVYTELAWNRIREIHFKPDLILIDGRFRVASLIQAWRFAPGCTVLFDDYKNRTHYHKVEELIKPAKLVGRIATFEIPRFFRGKGQKNALRLLPIYRYESE